jgi:hypothetical protein
MKKVIIACMAFSMLSLSVLAQKKNAPPPPPAPKVEKMEEMAPPPPPPPKKKRSHKKHKVEQVKFTPPKIVKEEEVKKN